jgi:hypothetical protein
MNKKHYPDNRERKWINHTLAAYHGLIYTHRQNELSGYIPCPTGDASTCPKCLTILLLEQALEEAHETVIFNWAPVPVALFG